MRCRSFVFGHRLNYMRSQMRAFGGQEATTENSGSLRTRLIGRWTLVSLEAVNGGEIEYPMGHDVTGVIIYDQAGHMAAQIMQGGRPRFGSGDMDNGTFAELSAALTGYVAYFGTYSVDDSVGVVTHHVMGRVFPNWVDTEQRREIV